MMFAIVLTTQRQDKDTLFQEIFIIKAIYNVSPLLFLVSGQRRVSKVGEMNKWKVEKMLSS